MADHILAIDQGTTSTRAIVFDADLNVKGIGQQEFTQHFPKSGWVEHDALEIWTSVQTTLKEAVAQAGLALDEIKAIGITNQRETTVIWDRKTGMPVHHAIVWQDRRSSAICEELKTAGHEETFNAKTGLLLDPYFSGTKVAWLLDHVPGLRLRAEAGELCFGTIDSWLIWKLTDGQVHATDATNASRTLMFNINTNDWDNQLLDILKVPATLLPEVKDCADDFGGTTMGAIGVEIPICGVAGDQQAAAIGNACFQPGEAKSTYGTGCFLLMNTGPDRVASKNRLLTTLAYRLDGEVTYALEGSIFMAGATVQWLRDGMKLIESAAQSSELAEQSEPGQDIYMVPAFTGLGAPYWDPEARGAIFGMTRNTSAADFCRAALESVGYQTRDLMEAMQEDWGAQAGQRVLRVDGGMVASDWTLQFIADILNAPVDRPVILETTAMGAAYLAGYKAGLCHEPSEFAKNWVLDKRFEAKLSDEERARKYAGWQEAVKRTLV